jgi:hypothetical protein
LSVSWCADSRNSGEGYTLFHYRTICLLKNLSKCQFGMTFVNSNLIQSQSCPPTKS